jgi:hypothetical protein
VAPVVDNVVGDGAGEKDFAGRVPSAGVAPVTEHKHGVVIQVVEGVGWVVDCIPPAADRNQVAGVGLVVVGRFVDRRPDQRRGIGVEAKEAEQASVFVVSADIA